MHLVQSGNMGMGKDEAETYKRYSFFFFEKGF